MHKALNCSNYGLLINYLILCSRVYGTESLTTAANDQTRMGRDVIINACNLVRANLWTLLEDCHVLLDRVIRNDLVLEQARCSSFPLSNRPHRIHNWSSLSLIYNLARRASCSDFTGEINHPVSCSSSIVDYLPGCTSSITIQFNFSLDRRSRSSVDNEI